MPSMDALWRPVGAATAAAIAAVACCNLRSKATASGAAGSNGLTAWFPAGRLRPRTPLSSRATAQWQALQEEANRCVGHRPASTDRAYAIVLLNTEPGCGLLGSDSGQSKVSQMLTAVWTGAAVIVVADGAANHLYDSALNEEFRRMRMPHIITGDLDSIRPDVLEYYTRAGVKTVPKPSQDAHDFNKSLSVAEVELQQRGGGHEVYVFCSAGGRFDHVAAMLSTMYEHERLALVLVTPFNTMWLLPAGRHVLLLDDSVQGTTCGLLPFGVAVREIESTGLQWDLGGEWGAMAIGSPPDKSRTYMPPSSSNEAVGMAQLAAESGTGSNNDGLLREIRVKTSDPIVWCVEHSRL